MSARFLTSLLLPGARLFLFKVYRFGALLSRSLVVFARYFAEVRRPAPTTPVRFFVASQSSSSLLLINVKNPAVGQLCWGTVLRVNFGTALEASQCPLHNSPSLLD